MSTAWKNSTGRRAVGNGTTYTPVPSSSPQKGRSSPSKSANKPLPAKPIETSVQNRTGAFADDPTNDAPQFPSSTFSREPTCHNNVSRGAIHSWADAPSSRNFTLLAQNTNIADPWARPPPRQSSLPVKYTESAEELARLLDEAEAGIQEKDAEIERLKAEMEEIRREWFEANEAETVIRNKDAEIEQLKAEMEQMQQGWVEAAMELAQTRVTANHTIDDEHFISQWKRLRYDIQSWATKYFCGGSSFPWFRTLGGNSITSANLKLLSPEWKSYLKSPEYRPLLIQAFVWNILSVYVFDSSEGGKSVKGGPVKGAYWAVSGTQPSIVGVNASLRPTGTMKRMKKFPPEFAIMAKEYFNWRRNTILFVERMQRNATAEHLHNNIGPLLSKIQEVLGPLATPSPEGQPFGRELRDILVMAIGLDADMWKQKAFFHPSDPSSQLRYPGEKMFFDKQEMERYDRIESDDRVEVTLVISPRLMKSGNSDGEAYEYVTTKVKSEVSCTKDFDNETTTSRSPFSRSNFSKSSAAVNQTQESSTALVLRKPSVRSRSRVEGGKFSTDLGRRPGYFL